MYINFATDLHSKFDSILNPLSLYICLSYEVLELLHYIRNNFAGMCLAKSNKFHTTNLSLTFLKCYYLKLAKKFGITISSWLNITINALIMYILSNYLIYCISCKSKTIMSSCWFIDQPSLLLFQELRIFEIF